MKASTTFALLFAAVALAVHPSADLRADETPELIPPGAAGPEGYAKPDLPIEIVFVMDTTGSMTRLLQGAKDKVWSIASAILKDNPKSTLKMGIVAYRDRDRTDGHVTHEEYVTKDIDLTDDLDSFYKDLIALQAKGGGDKPESVNQALQESIDKISWSQKQAIRIVFLVGDAPPHMDYPDDVKYPDTIDKASTRGIFINTIQCGTDEDTQKVWREIAVRGGGIYFALEQSGGTVAINTPQDKKLIELNADLATTVVPYGSKAQQTAVLGKASSYKDMPLEAAAARVSVNSLSGGRALQGKGDLVQDMQTDKGLVARLKPDDLPENMQQMTAAERQTYLDGMLARRAAINKEIAKVTEARDAAVRLEEARLAAIPAAPGTGAMGAGGGAVRGGAAGAGGGAGFGGGGAAGRGGGAGGRGGGGGGGAASFDGAVRAGAAAAGRAAGGK